MRRVKKWRQLQFVYMPGAIATPLQLPEDNAEDNDIRTAETEPLLLPSSLDPVRRERVCLHQVTEHERLLRQAQLQDSLIELRHTRKIRRKLMLNHYTQVAGQGVRPNTRSRTVVNSVENRITKFVERYRLAYRALLRLDPNGDWRESYLELKDCDNRGPGKESDEDGAGDGSYFRSWIWLPNPQVLDTADGEAGEEGASEEDVNEILRVEWTTSFARLERWSEEVDLLQEEMRRVVMFLEWKSKDWLAKADARGETLTLDIQSGLSGYAKKQAAVYHDLAVSFTKLWRPTLVSYGLRHSWATKYMTEHGVPLTDISTPASRACGIFKFRLANKSHGAISVAIPAPSGSPAVEPTVNDHPLLEEANYSEDSDSEDNDSEDDYLGLDEWDDDLDF
jgi:hypothetical protein